MTDNDAPTPDDSDRPGSVLPREALFEALTKDRQLPDTLSAATVPERLMSEAVAFAIAWLDQHRKVCRTPRMCPDTPGPLRMLLTVHRRESLVKSSGQIHAELWNRPSTTMVRAVREMLLDVHEDLTRMLETGELFEAEFLVQTLESKDREELSRLAAVLWARGLGEPAHRGLFRLLPVFINDEKPEPVGPPTISPPQETEKERHKRRRKAAEARAEELKKELARQAERLRERARVLGQTEEELQRSQEAVDRLTEQLAPLDQQIEKLTSDLRIAESEKKELETQLRRAREAAESGRVQLEHYRAELDGSDRDRRHLTRALATARTERDAVEAQLRAVPRRKDAVALFLEEEERRIDQDLTIAQGADRFRARGEHAKREKLEEAFRNAYPEYVPPRPTTAGETRTLRFRALGGGAEVGRSAYLVEVGSSRVLVDCGIAVGRAQVEEMIPRVNGIGRLDAVAVTHAHTDHIGWLPALIRNQEPTLPIYCTEDTADIAPVMLDDTRAHYERMLARGQQIAAHDPTAEPPVEAYSRDDLYEVETRLHAVRFDEPVGIPGTDLQLTFYWAGHILGAASVLLEGGGRRVLVSGDISTQRQQTLAPAGLPKDMESIDLLVLESTYGHENRSPLRGERDRLVEFVRKTTAHGTAVLPCFALGRAQEVLQTLVSARKEGRLPANLTIWVDGLIRRINPVYVERGRLESAGYQLISGQMDRSLAIGDCQRPDARAVVVTTSGMLNGGPVIAWADALLRDSRHRMALLGYQDESSPGHLARQLARRKRPPYSLRLPSEEGRGAIPLRIAGQIEEIALSAHADQAGLLDYAAQVPARHVALVHGDPERQRILAEKLQASNHGLDAHCPGDDALTIP